MTLEGPAHRPPHARGAAPPASPAPAGPAGPTGSAGPSARAAPAGPETRAAGRIGPEPRVALVDLLDRLLAGGVVISGDLTLSIADVDLVAISLRVLITSVSGQDVLEPARHD